MISIYYRIKWLLRQGGGSWFGTHPSWARRSYVDRERQWFENDVPGHSSRACPRLWGPGSGSKRGLLSLRPWAAQTVERSLERPGRYFDSLKLTLCPGHQVDISLSLSREGKWNFYLLIFYFNLEAPSLDKERGFGGEFFIKFPTVPDCPFIKGKFLV